MVCWKTKTLQGESRRTFLKLTTAFGAALGLDRAGILNAIADVGGNALAQEAAKKTRPSIHLVAGNGGHAWFQLLWPHVEVADSGNNNFAFHDFANVQPGDTDRPSRIATSTPFKGLGRGKQITAIMSGTNDTHTATPISAASLGNGMSMMAAAAAMQQVNSSLVPVIGIEPVTFGNATGAPGVTTVGDPDGIVELFNSAASRFALQVPQDAALFEATFKAQVSLLKAANRATMKKQLDIGRSASNFLGQNLADQLRPTTEDEARYEVNAGTPNKLRNIAKTFIIAAKAFKMGLTQSVILPVMRDDPHGAFGDMNDLNNTVAALGRYFDKLHEDLNVTNTETGRPYADDFVLTVHGDTTKNPLDRGGWPDGTARNSNWMYVFGNGRLKTGWFGEYKANGTVNSFNPATGDIDPNRSSASTAGAASAAALFAISADMRRVQEYFNAESIDGLIVPSIL